jgi:hypothetical protein
MPTLCCVPNCSNRGGFKFPNDKKLNLAWRVAIRREDERKKLWKPKKGSKVCSLHFKAEDFKAVEIESIGGAWKRKNLKPDAIPSVFSHSVELSESSKRRRERQKEKLKQKDAEQQGFGKKLAKCLPPEIELAPANFFSDEIGLQETEIESTPNINGKITLYTCIEWLVLSCLMQPS